MYSDYYQAKAVREKIWLVSGLLKNEGHIGFMRAVEGTRDILEFFVAPDMTEEFFSLMDELKEKGVILSLTKLPNRLYP